MTQKHPGALLLINISKSGGPVRLVEPHHSKHAVRGPHLEQLKMEALQAMNREERLAKFRLGRARDSPLVLY